MTNDERLERARNEVIEAAKRTSWPKQTHMYEPVQNLIALEAELADPVREFVKIAREYLESGSIEGSPPGQKDFGDYLEAAERHLEREKKP
jgi:hypothetical protein